MIRVAINGFGRIGRTFFRVLMSDKFARESIEIVAINVGPASVDSVAHAVKYDTLMGIYRGEVRQENNMLFISPADAPAESAGHECRIALYAERDPENLAWRALAVDWVVECSGHFTDRHSASRHLNAGARAVLISAPAKGEDVSIIPGINDDQFKLKKHEIVSLGSCTTNAFVPMLKVLNDAFLIENAMMTTVHAYTNTQVLLDVDCGDLRRSRAAALNIIPAATGAQRMVAAILPELAGKVQASALRVPVAAVSLIDLTVSTKKVVTRDAINETFANAAREKLRGILAVTDEPLVSSDFIGNSYSVVIDASLTAVSGSHMAKLFGWYDNEWGYSVRLKDFLVGVSSRSE